MRDRTEELTRLNSELALAKSTAEDANISKTRFLAAASHDILQPLNAARLYVTSLVERQNGGEDSRLVENIDEFAGGDRGNPRRSAGHLAARRRRHDDRRSSSFKIGDLMRSLEIEFAPIARAKGLELTFVPCSLPVAIRSAAAAAAAAEPDLQRDQIHPARTRAGRLPAPRPSLQIGVYDTGVGIPVVKRGEIFKEFHRLEQGARIARGLGLGLSIVERLARVLKHGIALDANASGGSVFSVTVPIAKGDQPYRGGHQRDAAVAVRRCAAR